MFLLYLVDIFIFIVYYMESSVLLFDGNFIREFGLVSTGFFITYLVLHSSAKLGNRFWFFSLQTKVHQFLLYTIFFILFYIILFYFIYLSFLKSSSLNCHGQENPEPTGIWNVYKFCIYI